LKLQVKPCPGVSHGNLRFRESGASGSKEFSPNPLIVTIHQQLANQSNDVQVGAYFYWSVTPLFSKYFDPPAAIFLAAQL